jgi:hypothetical protein
VLKAKSEKFGKLQKWKNGKTPFFHPELLDFDQEESPFRDFHQIPGQTVVFKAESHKLGKLQKWERWKTPISPSNIGFWSKMNHIIVVFVKFWVRQLCLKQNPKIWKVAEMGKCRFYPKLLDFDQEESHFRDFHQILSKTVMFKAKFEKFGKLQKWENGKTPFSPSVIGFDQEESHFRDFHQILGQTVVFEAKSHRVGKLQKWKRWRRADFTLKYCILIRMNHIFVIFIKFWVRQSCLNQNPKNLESCKNGEMGKRRFHPKLLDFGQEESHFRDFHQILGQTVVF